MNQFALIPWERFSGYIFLFIALIIWSIIWKGLALWKSARNNHLAWFIVMMLLNTAGILEILYIYVFSKKKKEVTPLI